MLDGVADAETVAALAAAPAEVPAPRLVPSTAAAPVQPVSADVLADEDEDDAPSAPRVTIPGGQRGPQKIGRVEWYTGPFEGMAIRVHVNPTRRDFGDIASGDDERQDKGVCRAILSHNLVDTETDEPLPTPLTPEALGTLPLDRYLALVKGVVEAIQRGSRLPKSG